MQEELTVNEDINEEDTDKVSSSNDIEESVIEESEEVEIEESIVNEESEEELTSVDESGELESEITAKEESTTIVDEFKEENETKEVSENFVVMPDYYSSDTSNMDYTELYQEMVVQQQATNELLYRINEQNDFIIGVGVTLIICCVAYAILEKFCRF